LEVEGRNHLGIYRARIERDGKWVLSKHRRFFCRECGSHLWASHERWPDLVHPVAGAVDTPLPVPPSRVHMMVGSKANWVSDPPEHEECFAEYPAESLADWHAHNGYRDRDA
jgi:hypothetical protein